MIIAHNHIRPRTDQTEFTRRVPTGLSAKQMAQDAKIARQMVQAWDVEKSVDKLLDIWFRKSRLLSNPRYWELLRTVWCAAGSTDNADRFRPYFKSSRPCRGWFMTPEDAAELEKMEFPLKVWRAYDREPDPGISWTINEEWCHQYAEGMGRQVKERLVSRDEVFAFISRRHEQEIIIL